jgi:predicted MFS family arabinose efflux permease
MRSMPGSVWRNRDFVLVLGGGLVNNIGDWLLAVALPAFVYTETGSGRSTAAIVVIELLIGIAFGPYGGSLADRWDLRRAVIVTNLLQAVALLPLFAVTAERIWPAFVVAAAQGLLMQVNDPASFAMVPRIVPEDQLVEANAANTAASAIARLIGSPLGGIAVVLGGLDAVVLIDAITFVAVAVATWFVQTPTASLSVSGADDDGPRAGVRDGWRQIRRHAGLPGYLGVQTLASLTFAMFPVLFIAFVIDVLDGDEATVGIIRGMAAFGGLAASILVGRFANHADPTRLMMWGYSGLGAVALVFVNITAVTTALWVYLVLFALSGLPNMTSQVGATTTAQRLCPPAVLGRLQGLTSAANAAGAIVGSVAVGLLIDYVDVETLLNTQALLYISCGVATYIAIIKRLPMSSASVGLESNLS